MCLPEMSVPLVKTGSTDPKFVVNDNSRPRTKDKTVNITGITVTDDRFLLLA